MRGQREKSGMQHGATEISEEELREFLQGDVRGPAADPEFKERLRRSLWEMVRLRLQRPPSDG